jgi:HPt (histidine-containing phosphotransfer) domain-containing protein
MPADATPEPALDPAIVAQLRHAEREYGNPEFIAQLIALFRANAPARLARIREAVVARDGSTLGHTAHTLKSNCAMLGATTLAKICARLEACADAAACEGAAGFLDAADAELTRVLRELDKLGRVSA